MFLLSSSDKKAYRRCWSGCLAVGVGNESFLHSLIWLWFSDAKFLESHFRCVRMCPAGSLATKATKHTCRTTSRDHRPNDLDILRGTSVNGYPKKRRARCETQTVDDLRPKSNGPKTYTGVGTNCRATCACIWVQYTITRRDTSTARVCNGTCRRWVMIVDCGRVSRGGRLLGVNIISVVSSKIIIQIDYDFFFF